MNVDKKLMEETLKAIGGVEEFRRQQALYRRSWDYIEKNREDLTRRYDGYWIAVYNGRFIDYDSNIDELFKKIERSGVSVDESAIVFITSKKKVIIL